MGASTLNKLLVLKRKLQRRQRTWPKAYKSAEMPMTALLGLRDTGRPIGRRPEFVPEAEQVAPSATRLLCNGGTAVRHTAAHTR
eukprot:3925116-Pleurochrysis_carterae.AAC.5